MLLIKKIKLLYRKRKCNAAVVHFVDGVGKLKVGVPHVHIVEAVGDFQLRRKHKNGEINMEPNAAFHGIVERF